MLHSINRGIAHVTESHQRTYSVTQQKNIPNEIHYEYRTEFIIVCSSP